ncbi:MAG: hypothetical protein LBJ70_04235 [Holosporales bacterium]|jgi:hypothetical protein|nr:hypothetical protein [Holosporales bacterium]
MHSPHYQFARKFVVLLSSLLIYDAALAMYEEPSVSLGVPKGGKTLYMVRHWPVEGVPGVPKSTYDVAFEIRSSVRTVYMAGFSFGDDKLVQYCRLFGVDFPNLSSMRTPSPPCKIPAVTITAKHLQNPLLLNLVIDGTPLEIGMTVKITIYSLTNKGIESAVDSADTLGIDLNGKSAVVYCSPTTRARDTLWNMLPHWRMEAVPSIYYPNTLRDVPIDYDRFRRCKEELLRKNPGFMHDFGKALGENECALLDNHGAWEYVLWEKQSGKTPAEVLREETSDFLQSALRNPQELSLIFVMHQAQMYALLDVLRLRDQVSGPIGPGDVVKIFIPSTTARRLIPRTPVMSVVSRDSSVPRVAPRTEFTVTTVEAALPVLPILTVFDFGLRSTAIPRSRVVHFDIDFGFAPPNGANPGPYGDNDLSWSYWGQTAGQNTVAPCQGAAPSSVPPLRLISGLRFVPLPRSFDSRRPFPPAAARFALTRSRSQGSNAPSQDDPRPVGSYGRNPSPFLHDHLARLLSHDSGKGGPNKVRGPLYNANGQNGRGEPRTLKRSHSYS